MTNVSDRRPVAVASPSPPASLARALVAALRPHQWVKNALVYVPALAAHRFDLEAGTDVAFAFAALSASASGGYVLNDLLDVSVDRLHARKRSRPFASGQLSTTVGVALVAGSWVIGFLLAFFWLPASFVLMLAGYLTATALYSLWLKRVAILDVMVLAGLYVLRVVAGGVAVGVTVSSWLLAFTLFLSLSLAYLKRYIEVSRHTARAELVPGRGYRAADAAWLHSVGLTSAYLGVLVLALYANSLDVTRLYRHPERLLLVCPILLFWMTRAWFRAHQGELHDDPVVAVVRDPVTYAVLGTTFAVVLGSI